MDWQQLPSHSRVWIYQSDRFFTEDENAEIKNRADEFVSGWSSHGAQLSAAIELFHRLFVVVFVDEEKAAASGCSIDKSMSFIKEIENKYQLKLTDRLRFAFLNNERVEEGPLSGLKEMLEKGSIRSNSLMFDNLMTNKKDFELSWLKTFSESWYKNYV